MRPEGFTPAKRGHAKNFLAWGYFQGADYFKDQAETIRAELLPIENPKHGFTAAAAAFAREIEASPFPVCLHWRCGDYLLPQNAALQVCTPEKLTPPPAARCASPPQAELFLFQTTPPMCGSIWTLKACRCITAPGQKCRGGPA